MNNNGSSGNNNESSGSKEVAKNAQASFMRIFPSIMFPMFIAVIDQTIVAAALPAMATSLGDVEHISWIVVAYLIANSIAAPIYGRLGDMFGRGAMMMAALAVMIVGSIACALSPNLPILVAARIVQGLGGGGLMTLSQALVGEAVPPRERARYQGYLAAVVVVSNSVGPVAGGWLTSLAGWRSIFWINLPLGLLAMALAARLPRRGVRAQNWRFDTGGMIYFVLFVASILMSMEQMRALAHGGALVVLGLIAVAFLSLFLLVRREGRVAQPLLPLSLMRNPSIWRCDAMAACHGAALVSLITYAPLYLRVVRGLTATQTGYFLLPMAVGIGAGSLVTGQLVSKTGMTAIFPAIALIPVAIVMAFVAFWHQSMSVAALSAIFGVAAFFMGSVMGVVQLTVQNVAGPAMLGAAAGSVQLSRSIGASFGTALIGALLLAIFTSRNPAAVPLFAELLEFGPSVLDVLSPAAQNLAETTLSAGFRVVFLAIDGFIVANMILAWTIPARHI